MFCMVTMFIVLVIVVVIRELVIYGDDRDD